jgi:hypothetical protein
VKYERELISRASVCLSKSLRDIWLVWVVLATVTTAPYVAAALRTPSGHMFTGVLTAYDDTFTYFAWTRQSADGRLLMCDMFTSEPQACEFFLPLWNILGLTARVTHAPIAVIFHAARILGTLLLLLAAQAVGRLVINKRRRVKYSLWLYATSGGFGWVVYAVKSRNNLLAARDVSGSVDLNLPEAIAFRSVFAQVHFAVGVALLCSAIKLFFDALVQKESKRAFAAGALVSLLAVVHPYMVVVALSVAGVTLLTRTRLIERAKISKADLFLTARLGGAIFATALPGVAYLVYVSRSNEVLREWLRITDTLSPAPWEYGLGFGFVLLLAGFGFCLMWTDGAPYGRLLLVWSLVQAALLYAPFSFQRRFVEGLQLPLCIAASVAFFWIADRRFQRGALPCRRVFLGGIIALASITNAGFIAGQFLLQRSASASIDSRRYVSTDLVAAFNWLSERSDPDAVVFSSYLTGSLTPSMTGLRVFLGHYGQTINSEEKGGQVTAFYTGAMGGDSARQLFMEQRVRYVIHGQFERAISDSFVPPSWLKLAYSVGDVEIFEVLEERGSGRQ